MNILELIKASSKMCYGVVIDLGNRSKPCIVTASSWRREGGNCCLTILDDSNKSWELDDSGRKWNLKSLNKRKISAYLYVGELSCNNLPLVDIFGKPDIPNGQKFRVRNTGLIGEFVKQKKYGRKIKITIKQIGKDCTKCDGKIKFKEKILKGDGKNVTFFLSEIEPYFD